MLRRSQPSTSFSAWVSQHVRGAHAIPHGIEEMAFDTYLQHCAGWEALSSKLLLELHRSLLVGREAEVGDGPHTQCNPHTVRLPSRRTADCVRRVWHRRERRRSPRWC